MEIDGKLLAAIALIPTATATAFAAFIFLDERHAHPVDVVQAEAKLIRRDIMSEATRLAQILHHYDNVQKERVLSDAELKRVDLAQREISRLHAKIAEGD